MYIKTTPLKFLKSAILWPHALGYINLIVNLRRLFKTIISDNFNDHTYFSYILSFKAEIAFT